METKLYRLKELLLEYSYQKKEVRLASGKLSDFYFDGKQTTLHPEGACLVGHLCFQKIRQHFPETQAVGGPTLGADPMVTAIAINSFHLGFPLFSFIVRKTPKKHGTQNWIEGASHLKAGMRVVMVEDVITTGTSLLEAIEKAKAVGLVVVGSVVLVDREEGGRENLNHHGVSLISLFKKSELLSA